MTREIVQPELVMVPHHELSYSQEEIPNVNSYSIDQIRKFDKQMAVHYARATGLQETGMSPNEIGLIYDLLEKKRPKYIIELGRNFGCSTRILLQYCVRSGAFMESWDLKHWGNVEETFKNQGFDVNRLHHATSDNFDYTLTIPGDIQTVAAIRIADSMKTTIEKTDRFVDFLLIDTEHGLENALGEYMRWRHYLRSGAIIAFHDSELPAVARAIDIAIEVESDFGGRILKRYKNARVEGFGIEMLEWKG